MKKIYKFKIDLIFLNIGSIILFLIIYIPIMILNKNLKITFNINDVVLMVLWLILHEILHGIGFGISKKTNKKNIKYGMELEKGIFYCMCTQRISKANLLFSLMLPFTLIGTVTLIIGLLINNYTLIMLSCINIAGAIGDLAMSLSIAMMPKNIEYIDLDDTSGFYLISEHDLSKSKLIGCKYDSCKELNDKNIKVSKRDKITISKLSYILMFSILGASIIYNTVQLIINII